MLDGRDIDLLPSKELQPLAGQANLVMLRVVRLKRFTPLTPHIVDELTDDEDCDNASLSSTVDLLDVQAMTFACLLCGEQHDPYKCGLLKGDAEAQRKVFANLREKRRAATKGPPSCHH